MLDTNFDNIPSLDLSEFTSGSLVQKQNFVAKLGDAFEHIGFVAIKNHGLNDVLVTQLYDTYQNFFQQPDESKYKYEVPNIAGQRGYTGKGKEHAKGRSTGDLKEFFHVGQAVAEEDVANFDYPENIFSNEISYMREVSLEAYRTLENTGKEILRAIALHLRLEEDYFDDKVKNGNSILRAIHYYPIENPDEVPEDAVRAAEHGDINLITLLMGASAEGLQILRKDGKWIPVTALPDQIVVNVGDMLERLTNNKLKSTIHRVVNPPREKMHTSRYSIPFFMHPHGEMDLTCLDSCIDEQNPKQYEDITAGQFLNQRLAEIGLKK
jgi:isopenicillin N synthase-like dioxygenase